MLPQDTDQDEDTRDEDDGKGNLAHGPRGERLDLTLRSLAVGVLMPAGEGGEEKETDEGKNDCDDAGFDLVSLMLSLYR